MIRAVIFDCDGTLVDSEHSHFLSLKWAFEKWGGSLTIEEYHDLVGKPSSFITTALAKKVGMNCQEELMAERRVQFRKLLDQGLPPIEHTVDFVHRLVKEREELKLGVASAAEKDEVLSHLQNLKIEHYFDVILSGHSDLGEYKDPEGVNKPKPYIYLHAAKMMGVSPSECVVIEDSHFGVRSGVDAGCFTIAVPNSYTVRQDLSHAHLRIESFSGIGVEEFFNSIVPL